MMGKRIVFLILLLASAVYSQDNSLFRKIQNAYEFGEYEKVISFSNSLVNNENITDDKKLDTELMRAVSFFALGRKLESKNSFIEILRIDKNFSPDPDVISPKIIAFFTPIKEDYIKIFNYTSDSQINTDNPAVKIRYIKSDLGNVLPRSIILPGWGHLYKGYKTEGYILSSLSILLASASVVYYIQTDNYYEEYQFQSNKELIAKNYDRYNTSYKIRNTLITSFAALWLYSQLDILILSPERFNAMPVDDGITLGY